MEIYLQQFPTPHRTFGPVNGGGTQVRWRADGKELFYVAPDGQLMAAGLERLDAVNDAVTTATPEPLFATRIPRSGNAPQQYVVSLDGQKFLLNQEFDDQAGSPIHVILDPASRQ